MRGLSVVTLQRSAWSSSRKCFVPSGSVVQSKLMMSRPGHFAVPVTMVTGPKVAGLGLASAAQPASRVRESRPTSSRPQRRARRAGRVTCDIHARTQSGVAQRQRTWFGSRWGLCGVGSGFLSTTGRAAKAPIIVRFVSTNVVRAGLALFRVSLTCPEQSFARAGFDDGAMSLSPVPRRSDQPVRSNEDGRDAIADRPGQGPWPLVILARNQRGVRMTIEELRCDPEPPCH